MENDRFVRGFVLNIGDVNGFWLVLIRTVGIVIVREVFYLCFYLVCFGYLVVICLGFEVRSFLVSKF